MASNGKNNNAGDGKRIRRRLTKEFKEQAVQMLLDGHSAASVAERLGLSGPSLLDSWKRQLIGQAGKTAATLESRVRALERELQRVERERDVLLFPSLADARQALCIFDRDGRETLTQPSINWS